MDAMDLDPPSPPRHPVPQQQLPSAFQSACPGLRNDSYPHIHQAPGARYDPVHGAVDDPWGSHQWQHPPPSHPYYMHQRSHSSSDSFPSFHGPGQPQAPVANEPYAYQLPFGYQTAPPGLHPNITPVPASPQDISGSPYYHTPTYQVPAPTHANIAPRLAPIHPAFRGMNRASLGGGGNGLTHLQQQSFPASQQGPFGVPHANSLRPQPPAQQRSSRGNSASNAPAWQQPHRGNPGVQAPPPQPPMGLIPASTNHQQQPRMPHSTRRYRPSMSRNATTNGDLASSPPRTARGMPVGPPGFSYTDDDEAVREAQFIRGAMSSKMVASMTALESLEKISISDLPEAERTCNICYNDFGVKTPEGVTEEPVRIPGCKHVFGNGCIKTWFEDADHCPYCRAKVHSERRFTFPAGTTPASNSFSQQLRIMMRNPRVAHSISNNPNFINELLHQGMFSQATPPTSHHSDRRPPPTNNEEAHRRQRPRHGSYSASQLQQQVQHQHQPPQTPPPPPQAQSHSDSSESGDISVSQPPTLTAATSSRTHHQHRSSGGYPRLSMMVNEPSLGSWQPSWSAQGVEGLATANSLNGNSSTSRITPGVHP